MKYQLVKPDGSPLNKVENLLQTIDHDALLKYYDDARDWLKNHPNSNDDPKYQKYVNLLGKVEQEGRRRQIVPFIPIEEIKKIFGVR